MSSTGHVVLVVDDTPANIDLLSGILRPHYKVKAATNGEKGLRIARADVKPDIILLDVMMPGMSGYEVCRELKEDHATAAIPVIFITAKTAVEDEQKGFELGAVDYITKPFNPVIVQSRVRTQLALYEKSKKLQRENLQLKEQVAGGFRELSESDLKALIQTGENDKLEFKSTLRWNLHTDKTDKRMENACLKTVAAYLNSDGGVLLVGVADDGTAIGIDKDGFANEDRQLLHWNSLVKTHLGVEVIQLIRSSVQALDDKRIMVIQSQSSSRPVFFSRDNEEAFFIRAGNGTQQLKPSQVLAYIDQRGESMGRLKSLFPEVHGY